MPKKFLDISTFEDETSTLRRNVCVCVCVCCVLRVFCVCVVCVLCFACCILCVCCILRELCVSVVFVCFVCVCVCVEGGGQISNHAVLYPSRMETPCNPLQ
jgi:hypothetical protein